MENLTVGVIGLGRMGAAIAHRLKKAGIAVVGYDADATKADVARCEGFDFANSLSDVARRARILWLMVPAGQLVDEVLKALSPYMQVGDVIIDGGNSHFKDSQRRAAALALKPIHYLDCGTSGGLHGREEGYSLMVGGDADVFKNLEPVFKALAAPQGYLLVGPSGAGHYVKMVHNGIEYALLQAYAEGFHVLKRAPFENLDLAAIANVWNHGSIIRSWINQLAYDVLKKDQDFTGVSGAIGENKTGQWTVEAAHEIEVPVETIELALNIRAQSRDTGGNYATQLVALLRGEFGGHEVKRVDHE